MNSQLHILRFIAAVILFIGGIVILVLRIPFWSLMLGIPSVQIGIVFIIFTFDALGKWSVENHLKRIKDFEEKEINKKERSR